MNIFYFVLGVIFCMLIMPILESLSSIIQQYTEYVCTSIATDTVKLQVEIKDAQLELEPQSTYAVGFQIPSQTEEEYDDEEEEE